VLVRRKNNVLVRLVGDHKGQDLAKTRCAPCHCTLVMRTTDRPFSCRKQFLRWVKIRKTLGYIDGTMSVRYSGGPTDDRLGENGKTGGVGWHVAPGW
jgi:hypothetical protein